MTSKALDLKSEGFGTLRAPIDWSRTPSDSFYWSRNQTEGLGIQFEGVRSHSQALGIQSDGFRASPKAFEVISEPFGIKSEAFEVIPKTFEIIPGRLLGRHHPPEEVVESFLGVVAESAVDG